MGHADFFGTLRTHEIVTGNINTGMTGPHNTIVSQDGAYVFMAPRFSASLVEGVTSTNKKGLVESTVQIVANPGIATSWFLPLVQSSGTTSGS